MINSILLIKNKIRLIKIKIRLRVCIPIKETTTQILVQFQINQFFHRFIHNLVFLFIFKF